MKDLDAHVSEFSCHLPVPLRCHSIFISTSSSLTVRLKLTPTYTSSSSLRKCYMTAPLHTTTTSILASPGILSIICSHCSQATLLSLSTTCQSVSTAALQQLWARLEWFGALIYTLPSDAWRATETDRAVTLVSVPRCCENGNEM